MSTFRRKKTECVGQYRVFDVHRHDVEKDGREFQAFTFTCQDWASIVPVTEDGRFILVRQYRHGIDGPTLEVPGGIVEEGSSPAATAVRELEEETGYGGGTLEPLGFSHPNPALQGNRHHMFLARGVKEVGRTAFDADEHCDLVVLSESELHREVNEGKISHALVLLALSRAFEALERDEVGRVLAAMEELQARKVIELARRLHPGLTAEDIRNPHDFPDLEDTDWHFEDGQLVGIQSVATALRALRRGSPARR